MTLSHLLSPNLPCILSYTSGVLHPVSHMMYSYTLSSTLSCILSCIYPHMPPYSHAFILSIYTSLGVHISADPLGFGLWGWKSQWLGDWARPIRARLLALAPHTLNIGNTPSYFPLTCTLSHASSHTLVYTLNIGNTHPHMHLIMHPLLYTLSYTRVYAEHR